MRHPDAYAGHVLRIAKALLAAYIATGLLLLLLAGLLYRFRLDEGKVQIGIILVYVSSCFFGGFLAGKMMKSRKFVWGVLIGLLYFLVMTLISLSVNRDLTDTTSSFITTFLLCLGGGMLGGMCA